MRRAAAWNQAFDEFLDTWNSPKGRGPARTVTRWRSRRGLTMPTHPVPDGMVGQSQSHHTGDHRAKPRTVRGECNCGVDGAGQSQDLYPEHASMPDDVRVVSSHGFTLSAPSPTRNRNAPRPTFRGVAAQSCGETTGRSAKCRRLRMALQPHRLSNSDWHRRLTCTNAHFAWSGATRGPRGAGFQLATSAVTLSSSAPWRSRSISRS